MTSMNISLPEELKEYIEEQTQRGYSTPSEYVRELIVTTRNAAPKSGLMPSARRTEFRRSHSGQRQVLD